MRDCFFSFFFLMTRRPPRSTRTDTLFPYTTLFRSRNETALAVYLIDPNPPFGICPCPVMTSRPECILQKVGMRLDYILHRLFRPCGQSGIEFSSQLGAKISSRTVQRVRKLLRSEERSVGKEGGSTCKTRGTPNH